MLYELFFVPLRYLTVFLCVLAISDTGSYAAAKSKPRVAALSQGAIEFKEGILQSLYQKLRQAESVERAHTLERAIEDIWAESGSSTVNLLMARALHSKEEKQIDICLNLLNEVISIAPEYAEGWYRRAIVHFERGNYSLALIDIRRVLALDPQNFQAINGLGLILREVGNKKAALKVFKKLLDVHPHYKDAKKAVEQLTREVEGQET